MSYFECVPSIAALRTLVPSAAEAVPNIQMSLGMPAPFFCPHNFVILGYVIHCETKTKGNVQGNWLFGRFSFASDKSVIFEKWPF